MNDPAPKATPHVAPSPSDPSAAHSPKAQSLEAQSPQTAAPPLTDSPWLWVVIFGGMALLGLAVIANKHSVRQERIERMQTARELRHVEIPTNTATLPNTMPSAPQSDNVGFDPFFGKVWRSVWALIAILALLVIVGQRAFRRSRHHYR